MAKLEEGEKLHRGNGFKENVQIGRIDYLVSGERLNGLLKERKEKLRIKMWKEGWGGTT